MFAGATTRASQRARRITACGVCLASGMMLAACGTSKMSVNDRISTVGVCVKVVGDVRHGVSIATQLASQSSSVTVAKQRLLPVQQSVTALAGQNAALPIGAKLGQLGTAVTALENQQSVNPADYVSSGGTLLKAAEGVLGACAAVGT